MQPESGRQEDQWLKLPATRPAAIRPAPAISSRISASASVITHATPRTVTVGDVALYNGLFGPRFAVQSSDAFAQAIGYPRAPVDDLLVFHIVFGKTVPDISLNAVANLGYAACRFLAPVYPGDTLNATSEVIGLKENSEPQDRHRVRALDRLQAGRRQGARICALGDGAQSATRRRPRPAITCRACRRRCCPSMLGDACPRIDVAAYDFALAGSPFRFGDYAVGEKIDHVDGMTVEEAEHQIATRLYQNTARIHFNQFAAATGPLRPPPDLRRPCDLARPRALLQRARQRLPYRRDQRRPPRVAAVRRRDRVRLVRGAGQGRAAGARRCRRAAAAHGRDQGPPVRRLPAQVGRGRRPGRAARSRLLGR